MSTPDESNEIIRCATEQAPHDMPYTEVLNASLYKKVEFFGERPELSVLGIRWYVEIEVRNLNDATIATALYRVWRDENGVLKAVRVTIA